METGRWHAADVEKAKGPHQDHGPERPFPLPLAGRRGDARAKRGHPPTTLQAPRQLDVLHERDRGKTTQAVEDIAADEDGLIARGEGARDWTLPRGWE